MAASHEKRKCGDDASHGDTLGRLKKTKPQGKNLWHLLAMGPFYEHNLRRLEESAARDERAKKKADAAKRALVPEAGSSGWLSGLFSAIRHHTQVGETADEEQDSSDDLEEDQDTPEPVMSFNVVYSLFEVEEYLGRLIPSLDEYYATMERREPAAAASGRFKAVRARIEAFQSFMKAYDVMRRAKGVYGVHCGGDSPYVKVNLTPAEEECFDLLCAWFKDVKAALIFDQSTAELEAAQKQQQQQQHSQARLPPVHDQS